MLKVDWPSNTFLGKKCGQKTPKNTYKHQKTYTNGKKFRLLFTI